MPIGKSEASLVAQNTFTGQIVLSKGFNLSVSGTWAGTITVQRSFDDGVTFVDVEAFTANTERVGDEPELNIVYRAGFKTGEYTSGTAVVRLSR